MTVNKTSDLLLVGQINNGSGAYNRGKDINFRTGNGCRLLGREIRTRYWPAQSSVFLICVNCFFQIPN